MTTPKKAPTISSPFIKRAPSKILIGVQFLLGLVLLIGIFILSEHLILYFHLDFPPALLGIGIALLALILLKRVPAPIQVVTQPLLTHMVLFFIPAIVGIVAYFSLIIEFPVALFMAIVVSTFVSLLLTAWLSQYLLGASAIGNKSTHKKHSANPDE